MTDLPGLTPASCTIVYPKTLDGVLQTAPYAKNVTLASLALDQFADAVSNPETKVLRSSCVAVFTTAGGGTPTNNAELNSLANQMATDWYRWQLSKAGIAFAGCVPWVIDGSSDAVEWTWGKRTTRIIRPAFNDYQEGGIAGISGTGGAVFNLLYGLDVLNQTAVNLTVTGTYNGPSNLTVKESDGTPSYTGISTVEADQAAGFVVTNPSSGTAKVSQSAASVTAVGYVNLSNQVMGDGEKSFADDVLLWHTFVDPPSANQQFRLTNSYQSAIGDPDPNDVFWGPTLEIQSKYGVDHTGSIRLSFPTDIDDSTPGPGLMLVGDSPNIGITDSGTPYLGQTGTEGGLEFKCGLWVGGSFSGSSLADGDYGDITVGSSGTTLTIDNDAITYAKMQNVSAASRLLGRGDSGSGDVQEITLGTGLSMSGTTLNASTSVSAPLTLSIDDAGTTTTVYPLIVRHTTSGTTDVAFGVGIDFSLENSSAAGNVTAATIEARWTDIAGEEAELVLGVASAGVITEMLTLDAISSRAQFAVPVHIDDVFTASDVQLRPENLTGTRTVNFPDASGTLVLHSATQTLTNKTFNLASNTLTGTTAEFNTALSDGNFATLAGSETLTNKTLTTPTLTTPVIADFSSATHDHLDADDGGTLSASAIASGTFDVARIPKVGDFTNATPAADDRVLIGDTSDSGNNKDCTAIAISCLTHAPGNSYVGAQESTTSASYVDLTTTQHVTFTLDAAADVWVDVSCAYVNTGGAILGAVAVDVDGSDNLTAQGTPSGASVVIGIVGGIKFSLSSGSHTLKMQFLTTSGTGLFSSRSMKITRLN